MTPLNHCYLFLMNCLCRLLFLCRFLLSYLIGTICHTTD